MVDWIIREYKKLNRVSRRILIFCLAVVMVISTVTLMTVPASAISGEGGTDTVLTDQEEPVESNTTEETEEEPFDDPGSEDENVDEINPDETSPDETNLDEAKPDETNLEETAVFSVQNAPESGDLKETPDGDDNSKSGNVTEEAPAAEPEEKEPAQTEDTEESDKESDSTADIETREYWDSMFSDMAFTGVWAEDLVSAAKSQVGYHESTANVVTDENGQTRGYSRYGAWYGTPYAEWNSLFVLFCLNYAGVPQSELPVNADIAAWVSALKDAGFFKEAEVYSPNAGDLVFADGDNDGIADHVGVITSVTYDGTDPVTITVIEGDMSDAVEENTYEYHNPLILGFAAMPEKAETDAIPAPEETEWLSFRKQAGNVEVTVFYEADAFPEGTELDVTPVSEPDVINAITDTVNKEVVSVQAVNIRFLNGEQEITPDTDVRVTMKSLAVPEAADENPVLVHVADDLKAAVVDPAPQEAPSEANDQVTFETKDFSVYAIVFTVNFTYELDGKEYTYTMEGNSAALLSDVVSALGIPAEAGFETADAFLAEVADVTFSNPEYLQVEKHEDDNDWTLTSLQSFTSEESLAVTMKNGNVFTIKVTDPEEDTRTYKIQITKYIVDRYGNPINFEESETPRVYTFELYKKDFDYTADVDPVKDMNIGTATDPVDPTGYALLSGNTVSVTVDGSTGEGTAYSADEANLTPGLYLITENPASIADTIIDTSGETWNYKETYFNTEYAWRNHPNDNYRHVSPSYNRESDNYYSVPEILGDHYGYNTDVTFTNDYLEFFVYNVYETETVNVPVNKTWADFDNDSKYDWEATFKLQWAPIYGPGVTADTLFRDVTPIQELTITKDMMAQGASSLDDRTFKDLPKYGSDKDGNPFRYQYSLEELSYTVTNTTTGTVEYAWDVINGYNSDDEDTQYIAFYPHDAGEESAEDTDYHIEVTNAKRNIRQKEYINIDLTKKWDDSFGPRDDTYYAEFELRRYAHMEYRDTSEMSESDRVAPPVTLTLLDGNGTLINTIQVQPNQGLSLAGNFKPHDSEKTITFSASPAVRKENGTTTTSIAAVAHGSNMSNAMVRSEEFFVTQDTVFTLTSGEENLVTEGTKAKILDTSAGTSPLPDKTFSQTIRLDSANQWHVKLEDLIRSETSAGTSGVDENVRYYEYYLVEKDSNPKGYAQYTGTGGTALGDSDHRIESNAEITAMNGPANRLQVTKYWRGIPDATGFPHVTFTLYQAWADGNEGWVYENENTHARYEKVEIPSSALTWICPEVLPTTRQDNGRSRAVKYYVQEDVREGSMSEEGITTRWQFFYYRTSEGRQTNAGHQGYFAAINGSSLASNGGTITICNKLDNYIQLDIQKQFFKLREAGSWDNVTSSSEMKRNAVLGFKVIRAIKTSDGKWLDEAGNDSVNPVWMDYSDEMLCGYDSNGTAVVQKGDDPFWLHDAGGDWHFRIEDNQGDATDIHAGGSGLPGYGYYIRNGEEIPVEYWYSYREVNVYKDVNKTPYPEWDWFSSITPVRAYGAKGTMDAFPKAFHGQDGMRIANFQASDLIIVKQWLGDLNNIAQEVFVKVWRTAPDGTREDFTAAIAEDVKNNNNWQMYVTDPSVIDVNRKWLIIKDDGTDTWTDTLKVNRALLGSLAETGYYHYYIQEVGYRDKKGIVHTQVDGKYKPQYDKWVDGDWTNAPKDSDAYASMNIPIGAKGENRLKVINTAKPSTSYTVTKSFQGSLSHSGGSSSVDGRYPTDGSKQVVVELQQRYRYEKTEGGVDYVSADNETWVRADSAEAKTTWAEDWQGAESANPTSVVLPLDMPEDYPLSRETWYASKDAWTYTWEGLDLQKVVSEDADPTKSKIAQLYYRAVETSTPGWVNEFITEERENGHKAIDDDTQTPAQIREEKNPVINEPKFIDLNPKKVWTGLEPGETWPEGYVVRYQIIQEYHLANTDTSGETPQYSYGVKFASVNMTRDGTGDRVHPQATGTLEAANHDLTLTGFPRYGFVKATAAIVEEAAGNGVILKEGDLYPVVYTYSLKETEVLKNGERVSFKEQCPSFTDTGETNPETDNPIFSATLSNDLGKITIQKEWVGVRETGEKTATIQLRRFEKVPEPTTFPYTVTVTGEDVRASDGSVTCTVYDSDNQAVAAWTLNKTAGWSHIFTLDLGKTYHAAFAGDGNVLNTEVAPASAEGIAAETTTELTASVIPTASGSVKLIVQGSPQGLWTNPLWEYTDGQWRDTGRQFNPNYFNNAGGETDVLSGLYPNTQYRFRIASAPNSCTGAEIVTEDGTYVRFTASDSLTEITLTYSGSSAEKTKGRVTGDFTNAWGNPYFDWNNLTVGQSYTFIVAVSYPPAQGTITSVGTNSLNYSVTGDYGASGQITVTFVPSSKDQEVVITVAQNAGRSLAKMNVRTGKVKLAAPPRRTADWTNNTAGLPEGANPTGDELVDTVTLTGAPWTKSWDNLPKYAESGNEYVYYAYETGYTGITEAISVETTYSVSENGTLVVTNTPTYPEGIDVTLDVIKAVVGEWPEGGSVTFTLSAEGAPLPEKKTAELTAAGSAAFDAISYTLDDLDGEASKTFTYTITETSGFGEGWTATPASITATVTVTAQEDGTLAATVAYTPENKTITNTPYTSAQVKKVWEGSDDIPESLTVTLYAEDTVVRSVTLNAANEWTSDVITQLPKYDEQNNEIEYHWVEGEMPDGFFLTHIEKTDITTEGTVTGVLTTLTNTYQENSLSTSYVGTKTWNGTKKPAHLTVNLYRTTTPETETSWTKLDNEPEWTGKDTNTWTYTFKDLPVLDADGNVYYYKAEEVLEAGYEKVSQTNTPTHYVKGTADAKRINRGDSHVITLTESELDLGFAIINKGNSFLIWTHRIPTLAERDEIVALAKRIYPSYKTAQFKTGFGTIPTKLGDITFSQDPDGKITVTFSKSCTWSTLAPGHFKGSAYNPGTTVFVNQYSASGTTELKIKKALPEGTEWPGTKTVTFAVAAEEGTPMPERTTVTLNAVGEGSFGNITWAAKDVGKTYTYSITETAGFGDGWTASGTVTATVVVSDNDQGEYIGEVTYSPETDTITNTYNASGTAAISAVKAISGAEWPANAKATFTLSGTGGTLPETKTVELIAAGTADFGNISYTLADLGGLNEKIFTYTITETTEGFGTGWSASPDKITATVKVTDNGDGRLLTSVTYSPEDKKITNTYKASGTAVLEAVKAISGAAWPEGGKAIFTLSGEGGTLPETKTVELTAAGTATFDAISYDETDIGKTYTYTITERASGFPTGWSASPDTITATVSVTDNKDGTLSTNVTYSPEDQTITNTYKASGTAVLEAVKAISGAAWPEGGKAIFTLSGEGGTLPETTSVELTAAGTATFDAISYDETDIGKTYTYTIKETASGFPAGWSASPDTITATVSVTDNKDGTLSTSVTYSPEDKKITNTYKASGTAVLEAVKEITGAAWPEGGKAIFTLSGEGGTLPETKTVELSAAGTATFDAISYDETDIGKTYTYTIKETASGFPAGWSASPDTITATVTVTDKGDGTLDTSIVYSPEDQTITNTYKAEGTTVLEIRKALADGSTWPEGKTAAFTLSAETEGAPMPEVNTVELSSPDTGTFGEITWTEADVGKAYTYTIEETSDWGDGWTKSDPVTVTVTVADNGEGRYAAEVKYSNEDTITNTHTSETTSLTVIKKYSNGNEKHANESVEVTLYKVIGGKETEAGKVTLSTSNGWKAAFDGLPIRDETGSTIQYLIRETKGGEGYTVSYAPGNTAQYDGSKLKDITITNTKEEPKETPTPTPSEPPKKERRVPKTSDDFNAFFWISTLLVSAVTGCLAAVTLHRYN